MMASRGKTFVRLRVGGRLVVQLMGCVLGLAFLATPAASAETAVPGLVAAYAFEEGAETAVADSSGNGNDGTIGSATWTDAGKYGNALSFNGYDANVTVPDAASLHLREAMTLEAWIKPATLSVDWQDVIFKGDDNYYLEASSPRKGWRAGFPRKGRPAAGSIFDGTYGETFGPTPLPIGTWTYLAATYDGATLRLYVDGVEVSSTARSASLPTSGNPLQIGGDSIYGQYFHGLIDEVRVYDVARTAEQIRSDMTTPVDTAPPPDTTPPSAPTDLTATAAASDRVDVSWSAASDDRAVAAYELERCSGDSCTDFAALDTTTDTAYGDTSVAAGTSYTYRVRAVDTTGNAGPYSGSATATTPAPPPVGPGPIAVGPTGRYLVDGKGSPFLITGDAPQALIGNLTESDAELYFADRRAHGFNTVWINLLCNSYTACRDDGSTFDGIPPFTTPGDFSTANEAYFARADRIIRLAGDYGLVVILDPAETGGWLTTMVGNGIDKLRAYGRYLGSRYKDFPNIIWMSGNDYQNWGEEFDPYVTAVALGIADTDPSHIQTVELNYLVSSSLDDQAWAPIIRLNASYTYSPTYEQILKDYNRSDFLPTFLVEASYEFEGGGSTPVGTPAQLRRQEYWSLLSGATGQLYGSSYTWRLPCWERDASGNCIGGWKDLLDSPGAVQMRYLRALFDPRPWYALVPDQEHSVVTSGYGTFGETDYVTAARTPDGTLVMAYLPTPRTITVDMSRLSGTATARWYDPTTGTYTPIGELANVGEQQLTPPDVNGAGDGDWVLVIETS